MEDFIPPNCPSVSLPQMKISRNESSFPFYLQRQMEVFLKNSFYPKTQRYLKASYENIVIC